MPVIDLHSHSRYSDGALSPAALVARAHERGVTVLALTDHDSVRGVPEAMAAAQVLGMEMIPAVEIEEPGLQDALGLQAGARGLRARHIAERFDKLGLAGSYEAVLALAGDPDSIGRAHFAQWLLGIGRVNTMQQAFDRYLGQGKPADVALPWMPLEAAVAVIRAAGGHAVLAHPGRYDMTRTKLRELITAFKAVGGVALEVATATEKPDIVRYLGQLTTQFDLYASQGSDFHGAHMPWIELGRFPPLPPECRPVWQLWQPVQAPV